ncbi:MAG: MFS transporter [Ignavibacteriales bacterium]|nr:MAG: MFS transporter [Ignavibacteriales bacterium]
MELFERLAYYGQAAILSVFLRDHLKFDIEDAGLLQSIFGGLIYFLPIFAGALADKFGFKKAFTFAFFILAIGYFLIGSTGMEAFSGWYSEDHLFLILSLIFIFTAIGGSFIKPSVLGTIAVASSSENKSFGYAIYYWIVNIGAAIGPILALIVRDSVGIQFVYLVSSFSCALMLLVTLFFFKEPEQKKVEDQLALKTVAKNMWTVLNNFKFIVFLLIFSLYWVVFWEYFIVVPYYVRDYIAQDAPFEIITATGAFTIVVFQIPINLLTKRIPTFTSIIISFILAATSWLMLFFVAPLVQNMFVNITSEGSTLFQIGLGIPLAMSAIFIFSVGEQTQAPKFYEYLADLAPKGQAALFQGFAFLPIAIAFFIVGPFGGWIYKVFAVEQTKPEMVFLVIGLVGILATILMIIYNGINNKK